LRHCTRTIREALYTTYLYSMHVRISKYYEPVIPKKVVHKVEDMINIYNPLYRLRYGELFFPIGTLGIMLFFYLMSHIIWISESVQSHISTATLLISSILTILSTIIWLRIKRNRYWYSRCNMYLYNNAFMFIGRTIPWVGGQWRDFIPFSEINTVQITRNYLFPVNKSFIINISIVHERGTFSSTIIIDQHPFNLDPILMHLRERGVDTSFSEGRIYLPGPRLTNVPRKPDTRVEQNIEGDNILYRLEHGINHYSHLANRIRTSSILNPGSYQDRMNWVKGSRRGYVYDFIYISIVFTAGMTFLFGLIIGEIPIPIAVTILSICTPIIIYVNLFDSLKNRKYVHRQSNFEITGDGIRLDPISRSPFSRELIIPQNEIQSVTFETITVNGYGWGVIINVSIKLINESIRRRTISISQEGLDLTPIIDTLTRLPAQINTIEREIDIDQFSPGTGPSNLDQMIHSSRVTRKEFDDGTKIITCHGCNSTITIDLFDNTRQNIHECESCGKRSLVRLMSGANIFEN